MRLYRLRKNSLDEGHRFFDRMFMGRRPPQCQNRRVASYTGNQSFGWPICPDFLRRLVTLIHSMRLSLMKGAHADLSSTAWQEIGVKPFVGLSGL